MQMLSVLKKGVKKDLVGQRRCYENSQKVPFFLQLDNLFQRSTYLSGSGQNHSSH
jgi:hypothetical protein